MGISGQELKGLRMGGQAVALVVKLSLGIGGPGRTACGCDQAVALGVSGRGLDVGVVRITLGIEWVTCWSG